MLIAILKAIGLVLFALVLTGTIVLGSFKAPVITFILTILSLTIITAIGFYNGQ